MSGLSDLAAWALRGGAGNTNNEEQEELPPVEPQLSPEEIRAQRLARMEQQQAAQQQPEPMEVDEKPEPSKAEPVAKKVTPQTPSSPPVETQNKKKKQKSSEAPSPVDKQRKVQRKKELVLKKTLSIVTGPTSNSSVTSVDIDEISVQTLDAIIAERLCNMTLTGSKTLLSYLSDSHRKASEEHKTILQSNKNKDQEVLDLLQEIQTQTVNYGVSCLLEPDLFPAAEGSTIQLAKALDSATMELDKAITFGVNGSSSSYYYQLVEEILKQDEQALERIITECTNYFTDKLSKCESVLDSAGGEGSSVTVITALKNMCVHKRVAETVTKLPSFLLPAAGTPEAAQEVRPVVANPLAQMMLGQAPAYLKRSGPALEKHTLLGLALRVGIPMRRNSAFPPASVFRQSPSQVTGIMRTQRGQLKTHQEACNQLIMALVKGGPVAREQIMKWFTDALLVNSAASGMRPDPAKVSSSSLLLNLSVALLKLCEPFVIDPKKHHLIDTGFVSSPDDHGGVFPTTGDDAVARLGGNEQDAMTDVYHPKNSFIPQCFFLCARSLHLGIGPQLSMNYNLLMQISRLHHELTSTNQELQSNQRFQTLVSFQRSFEVSLYQEEPLVDTLRFCNLMAKTLFELPDEKLKAIPEDFVSDSCDLITQVAKQKGTALAGVDVGYVFKLCVKLLSPGYADLVRNYNLRAMLGDALYEIFLPTEQGDRRRDVPASVFCDPAAGGQPYLLADKDARETLAPSLLLLYGEVEQTGYYDKMSHRANICNVLKYLWDHEEHRQAFRRITQNRESFITFANGMMNETNNLISTVMQKLPEIREIQMKMRDPQAWSQLNEEQQGVETDRLESAEREVKSALPLCNKTLQMFSYLNTDSDIRRLFLLDELISRLVQMLLHVMTKLVGSKGLDLKVDNPEQYDFRPKEMLRDLCAICALFSPFERFQTECAKAAWDPNLLESAVKTCKRLGLLRDESMEAFESLPGLVQTASEAIAADEALLVDAPDEFMDELLSTYMVDPVLLPSGHIVDRSTISQHLLNDSSDPFNREPLTMDQVKPATELKARMEAWLAQKRAEHQASNN